MIHIAFLLDDNGCLWVLGPWVLCSIRVVLNCPALSKVIYNRVHKGVFFCLNSLVNVLIDGFQFKVFPWTLMSHVDRSVYCCASLTLRLIEKDEVLCFYLKRDSFGRRTETVMIEVWDLMTIKILFHHCLVWTRSVLIVYSHWIVVICLRSKILRHVFFSFFLKVRKIKSWRLVVCTEAMLPLVRVIVFGWVTAF